MYELLNRVNELILNPLIILLFAVAFLVFFWGIVEFIYSEASSDTKRKQGQQKIIYGLIGMFVMFSAYGLIHFLLDTFSIPEPPYIFDK